jgi:hypothetical protein
MFFTYLIEGKLNYKGYCVSSLEGREAGAKHRAEGEPVRVRPRRGNAQILNV